MTLSIPMPDGMSVDAVMVGSHLVRYDWMDGVENESSKSFKQRLDSGFFAKYCSGDVVLDVGYRRSASDQTRPVLPYAIGVDDDYPDYNGITLPFESLSVDTVYSSHLFEHLRVFHVNVLDWYRVLKVGGFIVAMVPHQHLYEKRARPPSRWNVDHYQFYTPAKLLALFEDLLPPNCYRVRHLADNDRDYSYDLGPDKLPAGCYEIELCIQKIAHPGWVWPA